MLGWLTVLTLFLPTAPTPTRTRPFPHTQVMKLRDELIEDPTIKFYAAHHNCKQTPDESMMLVKMYVKIL